MGEAAKDARRIFDSVTPLDGFEVWRRLVGPMAPRTLHRRHDLYTKVHSTGAARSLAGVEVGIEVWETDLDRYIECGGTPPTEARR